MERVHLGVVVVTSGELQQGPQLTAFVRHKVRNHSPGDPAYLAAGPSVAAACCSTVMDIRSRACRDEQQTGGFTASVISSRSASMRWSGMDASRAPRSTPNAAAASAGRYRWWRFVGVSKGAPLSALCLAPVHTFTHIFASASHVTFTCRAVAKVDQGIPCCFPLRVSASPRENYPLWGVVGNAMAPVRFPV